MRKLLAVVVMATALGAGSAVTASAAAPSTPRPACHPTRCVAEAAYAVTTEVVYGPLYAQYKAQYPKALDWNNNGCSFPKALIDAQGGVAGALADVLNHYGDEFQKSCDRHDFGYRNHDKSGIDRKTVDRRLRDNMYKQCDVNHTDYLPPWWACRAAAKVIFEAVDSFGYLYW